MLEVLLMGWNNHFDWTSGQYDFIEIFCGAANTARTWWLASAFIACCVWSMHCAYPFVLLCYLVRIWNRKRQGCNVAAYDIDIGEAAKKPNAMDFLSNSGFLSLVQ